MFKKIIQKYKKHIDIFLFMCYNIYKLRDKNKTHKMEVLNMYTNKEEALRIYKEAKEKYLSDMTNKNWIEFCNAKSTCMKLGVRI